MKDKSHIPYELSTDYDTLWVLIKKGFRIPAWIEYPRSGDDVIYDIVEVKMRSGYYMIGTRGIGYDSGYQKSKDKFIEDCEHYKLEFALPSPENFKK